MIKLDKHDCPEILRENKDQWTADLMSYGDDEKPPPSVAARYNHPEIKSALREETHGKCAYCESDIEHVDYGDIEHIKPKSRSKYPELTFEWENLGYVCGKCNTKKGDKYDESCPPINPYEEDPSEFLVAIGPRILHKTGSEKGQSTVILLKLNRKKLLEKRWEKIERLITLLDNHDKQTNEAIKKSISSAIEAYIAEDSEYSFCLKTFHKHLTA